jgi:DNA polymerase-3 subunit epsilon
VYLELIGGRQHGLGLAVEMNGPRAIASYNREESRQPRPIVPTQAELAAHADFIAAISGAVWSAP